MYMQCNESWDFCLWVVEQTQFSGVKEERRARRRRFSGGFSGLDGALGFSVCNE